MSTYPDFTLAHMGLNVPDREAAEAWYEEHLGLRIVRSVPGRMSFLADPTGRVILELYANPSVPKLDLPSTHPLTLHLAFLADDLQATADRLVAAGAEVQDPYKETEAGDRMVMLKDPFGLGIQLIKRAEPMF